MCRAHDEKEESMALPLSANHGCIVHSVSHSLHFYIYTIRLFSLFTHTHSAVHATLAVRNFSLLKVTLLEVLWGIFALHSTARSSRLVLCFSFSLRIQTAGL